MRKTLPFPLPALLASLLISCEPHPAAQQTSAAAEIHPAIDIHASIEVIPSSTTGSIKPFYIVGDQQRTSAPELLMGREQNDTERELIVSAIQAGEPAFLIELGDMVFEGSNNKHWEKWDELMAPVIRKRIPIYPVMGNHDYYSLSVTKAIANVKSRFAAFRNGMNYALQYNNLGLIFVDSNKSQYDTMEWAAQKAWYEARIAEFERMSQVRGILVFMHHPPYTNSKVTDDEEHVQQTFVPAFVNSYKAMAFITGHAHGYERFRKSNKMFVISAGGGGPRVDYLTGTKARHADEVRLAAPRPFNYLIVSPDTYGIQIKVRGVQKGSTVFSTIDEFAIAF